MFKVEPFFNESIIESLSDIAVVKMQTIASELEQGVRNETEFDVSMISVMEVVDVYLRRLGFPDKEESSPVYDIYNVISYLVLSVLRSKMNDNSVLENLQEFCSWARDLEQGDLSPGDPREVYRDSIESDILKYGAPSIKPRDSN